MDKTLRRFVIVACTVVIATPAVFMVNHIREQQAERAFRIESARVNAERMRQRNRVWD